MRATFDYESNTSQPGFFHFDAYGAGLSVPSQLLNVFNPGWWRLQVADEVLACSAITLFEQTLDMLHAETSWIAVFVDGRGRQTQLEREWFLPADRAECVAIRTIITPLNHSAPMTLYSGFDWRHGNGDLGGVFPDIRIRSLRVDEIDTEGSLLKVSGIIRPSEQRLHGTMQVRASENCQSYRERDIAAIATTFRTRAVIETVSVVGAPPPDCLSAKYRELQMEHRDRWSSRWVRAPQIDGPAKDVQGLRFSQFQMLQCADRFRPATNVAARGLSSEYHSGHFFFNTELYLTPWFALTDPSVARALIRFRTETLDAARDFARSTGFEGARFPEEADRQGRLAAPAIIKDLFTNTYTREWSGDLVTHISGCVLFALALHLNRTGDTTFFEEECVTLVAECAKYLYSLTPLDLKVGGRGATNVMCFDEFHYPVDHHTATNALARWSLSWASNALDRFAKSHPLAGDKLEELGAGAHAREQWRQAALEMYIPPSLPDGTIPQFHGYFDLTDCVRLAPESGELPKMRPEERATADRLEPFTTQLCKQADVLLLLAMLPGLADADQTRSCLAYYEQRTLHASSLSMSPHAIVAAVCGDSEMLRDLLIKSARYNLDFEPRANYSNGIHFGACAGALLALAHGVLGLSGQGKQLTLRPCIPATWSRIVLPLFWKNNDLWVTATPTSVTIYHAGGPDNLELQVDGDLATVSPNETLTFALQPRAETLSKQGKG